MQVLKLGGSVITDKDEPMTPDMKNINRLVDEIKAAWPIPIILIHGGGSYGHPYAKKYNLSDGYTSDHQIIGYAKTHQAMVEINSIITDALIKRGIPAISVTSSSFITTYEKRIVSVDLEILGQYIIKGFLPVLYGDTVIDKKQGFSILSGDQLAVKIATRLGAKKVIFGADVDGVYTSNPKLVKEAKLIDVLPLDKIEGYIKIGQSLSTDVTGGMLGKVTEAIQAVKAGVDVQIVNAAKAGVIFKALRGEKVSGTILTRG